MVHCVSLTVLRLSLVFGEVSCGPLGGGKDPAHPECPVFEVNVLPLQAQELTLPQPRRDGQDLEGFKPITAGRLKQ